MRFNKKMARPVLIGMLIACLSFYGRAQTAEDAAWPSDQKLFIHTDKEEYLAGELLWFKTYLVEANTMMPVHQISVTYVELLDRKGKSVLQGKIPMEKVRRDGCFYLPADLNTGTYTLVGYTTDMKNKGTSTYFRKRINIINTFKPLPAAAMQKGSPVFIGFYPEGGTVMPGVATKFGFYVMNSSSRKGLNAKGIITDQKNDTVASFSTLEFGMGQVRFTPAENEKYTAIIHLSADSTIKKELIFSRTSNYFLSVESPAGDRIKITARCSSNDQPGKEKVRLLVHARQTTRAAIELELENGRPAEYFIERSKLGTGVVYFTLFNSKDQPVCERLFFTPPDVSAAKVNIRLSKDELAKRDSLNIGIGLEGVNATDTLNGSLAIIPATAGKDQYSSIYEYFLLGADVPGEIEDPRFYFTEKARTNPEYIENLMLVNGWRQFSATAPAKNLITAIPEYHGHIVTARVSDTWTNSPKERVQCTLTTPSSPFGFYTALSDSNGIVRFNVQNYLGPGTIVLKATTNIKPNPFRIELISPFDERSSTDTMLESIRVNISDSASLIQRSLAMQTINTFQHDEINRFIAPVLNDTFPFYGKPEFSYDLDKYTRFSTMEEVLREYVTPITVAMKGSRLTLAIYNENLRVFYNDFMLVMLDGVPLTDPHQIFNYDPYKVKRIEIVPRRYLYGSSQYYGIASFETYTGQFDAVELDPSSLLVDYEGLQLKREFYSPVYTTNDKGDPRIPDLRTTLLWVPNIDLVNGETKKTGSYTSDFTGPFNVVFCGITASGLPVQETVSFTVK